MCIPLNSRRAASYTSVYNNIRILRDYNNYTQRDPALAIINSCHANVKSDVFIGFYELPAPLLDKLHTQTVIIRFIRQIKLNQTVLLNLI